MPKRNKFLLSMKTNCIANHQHHHRSVIIATTTIIMIIVVVVMMIIIMIGVILYNTTVTVREVYVEEPGHRLIRSPGMPAKKKFIFRLNEDEIVFDLQLNSIIREDVNIYVTENGVTKLMEIHNHDEDKEMHGYYQDKKTNAAMTVTCYKLRSLCQPTGTFMLNGKKYRLESTGELSNVTLFVTEIHPEDKDVGMHKDLPQISEIGTPGPRSGNQNKNSGNGDNPGRVKRAIPAGVDIVELFVYTDESIYQRFLALYGNMTTALSKIQQYYAIMGNEDASGAPWSYQAADFSGNINSSKALNDFSTWQKNYAIANNLRYDHAMAMTNLAANHDPTTGPCSNGYIMVSAFYRSYTTTATTKHKFSSCSISSMTNFLSKLG
ncbi:hypothetical protein CHS0354_032253 [Potamilus streckersoni]|uniref:Uncharacterized protein n=1 Tax=Potamilus streckersoni TaxID=2493646 RepID=A0AAE0RQE6_9BIVA|nr:hypothetical protein CHS0354_032253 [Potamilus streckersoni]